MNDKTLPLGEPTDDAIADAMIDANLNPGFCIKHAATLQAFGRAVWDRAALAVREQAVQPAEPTEAQQVAAILQSHLGASRNHSGLSDSEKALWDKCDRVMFAAAPQGQAVQQEPPERAELCRQLDAATAALQTYSRIKGVRRSDVAKAALGAAMLKKRIEDFDARAATQQEPLAKELRDALASAKSALLSLHYGNDAPEFALTFAKVAEAALAKYDAAAASGKEPL